MISLSDWISEIGLTLVVSGLAVPVDFYTVYVHAGVRSTHLKRPYSPKKDRSNIGFACQQPRIGSISHEPVTYT